MTLDEALKKYPGAETFRFGDNADLSAELLVLVRSGRKTATCGPARYFGATGEAVPKAGRYDIALEWDSRPALVIQTTHVATRRFCDVDEDFALAEGEDDTLEGWQEGHRRYFERNHGFEPEMELICERFRLIEYFAKTGKTP